LFSVNDGVHGQELWITDGTTEGTFLLKDIWPGPGSSFVREFALSLNGEHVYFTASHDSYGDELWQTDGTPEGTILLADVNPGPAPSNPSDIVEKGGFIYFAADSESYGRELFVVPAADTSQDPYINWIAAWPDLDLTGARGSMISITMAFLTAWCFSSAEKVRLQMRHSFSLSYRCKKMLSPEQPRLSSLFAATQRCHTKISGWRLPRIFLGFTRSCRVRTV
jgi:ELWxxDGT repeat protein